MCCFLWLIASLQKCLVYRGIWLESLRTCSEAFSGIHNRFILYLFELDNFKYSIPNLVFLLIWSVIPKRTPPAPSGLKKFFFIFRIQFFIRMKLDICLPSPKKCLRGEVGAHYEVRNARKADISGKFCSEFEHAKTTEFHGRVPISSNAHELFRFTKTRSVCGTLFRIMQG